MNHGENFHRRHLLSTTIANISARTLVRTALLWVQRLPRGRRSRYPRGDDTPLGTHGPPQRHPAGGARGHLSRGGGARLHRLLVGGVRRRSVDRAGARRGVDDARVADGVITNWLSADDVTQVVAVVRDEARKVGKDPDTYPIVCRITVCPGIATGSDARAREQFRRAVTAYLNVPVYRRFHRWLGRGQALAEMNAKWDAGDRKGALAAVPERAIDDLAVLGTPEQCREALRRYVANGVTVPVLNFMNLETDPAARAEER